LFFESDESNTRVRELYQFASGFLNVPIDELISTISDNFANVFKISSRELE